MVKEESIHQDFEAQIPEEEEKPNLWQTIKPKLKKIDKRLFFLGGGLLAFLALLIIVGIVVSRNQSLDESQLPVLPSSPSSQLEEIINPSAYATDSAVLEIEKRVKKIKEEINKTDLKEVSLNLPVLDMEVSFEE